MLCVLTIWSTLTGFSDWFDVFCWNSILSFITIYRSIPGSHIDWIIHRTHQKIMPFLWDLYVERSFCHIQAAMNSCKIVHSQTKEETPMKRAVQVLCIFFRGTGGSLAIGNIIKTAAAATHKGSRCSSDLLYFNCVVILGHIAFICLRYHRQI